MRERLKRRGIDVTDSLKPGGGVRELVHAIIKAFEPRSKIRLLPLRRV